jgi:hypothetical protein
LCRSCHAKEHEYELVAAMHSPEALVKLSIQITKIWTRPGYRKKASKAMKKGAVTRWSIPANRTAHKAARNTPEWKSMQRAIALTQWADPAFRAKMEAAWRKRKGE